MVERKGGPEGEVEYGIDLSKSARKMALMRLLTPIQSGYIFTLSNEVSILQVALISFDLGRFE